MDTDLEILQIQKWGGIVKKITGMLIHVLYVSTNKNETNIQFYKAMCFQSYKDLFDGSGTGPGEKTLEDKFFEQEVNTGT